jgi:glycosyltransferase involved in cell wall biosynthesis
MRELTDSSVAVVICAYLDERRDLLDLALASLESQTRRADEVVVVIDGNEALSRHVRARDGDLRVIDLEVRSGLSTARNAGVAACSSEVVLFLDDDAEADPQWVERLTDVIEQPGVLGASGHSQPVWDGRPARWLPEEFFWMVGASYRGQPQRRVPVRNVYGGCCGLRREIFTTIGGYNANLGMAPGVHGGGEEAELCLRAKTHWPEGEFYYEPAAKILHHVDDHRARLSYLLTRAYGEGRMKASVASICTDALGPERAFAAALPRSMVRNLFVGLFGDVGALRQAVMIPVFSVAVLMGLARGRRLTANTAPVLQPDPSAQGPERASKVLSCEFEWISATSEYDANVAAAAGTDFDVARVLVRVVGVPVGFVDVPMQGGQLRADDVIKTASAQLKERIQEELSRKSSTVGIADESGSDQDEMSGGTPQVSVAICTRNRPEGAVRTLRSVLATRTSCREVLIIDNNPDDDSTMLAIDRIAREDARVRYVREERRGLSRARNRAIQEASGTILAFTDDDVLVDELWLDGILGGFERDPAVACVTGLVASASLERPEEQFFDRRVWWSSSCEQRLHTGERSQGASVVHPYSAGVFGTGANFAFKLEALREAGGFDECLGAGSPTGGGEDLDIFVRLIRRGYAISYEPEALVWHEHRVDAESLRKQMYGYGLGLGAYATKYLISPESRADVARRLTAGVFYTGKLALRSRRASDSSEVGDGLLACELRGLVAGPIAYLRARAAEPAEHLRAVAP